ncbi:histidine kinase [Pseudonocardia sulfidoxydans NBRC 16205]|uniref:Histidine kinase n=2 Tax=Pseudonocardia sulfidoxydans TaxID=54011 RepID=A0A511DHK9_9PSEU|nr:GAF domain-containing protein [Pseudonocardia sulfidoxydans]GEL24270.1 histidine kinase [Pseudonocardia sulfidoxydans NBRC 16205]
MSPDEDAEPALTFPDLPRLELDQLLGQLVDRAGEVMAAQGRLRGLLQASQAIVGDLELPVVLRRIVESARTLLGARYAALGVLADAGGLAEFVHTGLDDETVARIGDLPAGRGLLGTVITGGAPIRLRHVADDPRSSGFPPGHPVMESFLGVPIRIREEVFGNLYLTESERGEFSAEDEELARALAATAAVAIDNARLFRAVTVRGEWMAATAAVTREMLDAPGAGPLRLIVERSRELAGADVAVLVRPDADRPDTLRVDIVDAAPGLGDVVDELRFRAYPMRGSVTGEVFTSATALRLIGPDELPGLGPALTAGRFDAGPMLVVPLVGPSRTEGVLTVVRGRGGPVFRDDDLQLVAGFANQAAVALELAEGRTERERLRMLDERERIAADLHDHVIQRLFGAGLSLQAVAARLGGDPQADAQAERLRGVVGDLDDTIARIRTTIFALQQPDDAHGLRVSVLRVVDEAAEVLGFGPALRFTGPADTLSGDDELVDDLVAVLREALTNVAKHAAAAHVEVDLVVDPGAGLVELVVADDGRGPGEGGRRSGLANLQRRAERRGGTFALAPGPGGGSRLTWTAGIT